MGRLRLAGLLIVLSWAAGPGLVPEEAAGTGRTYLRPGWAGGSLLGEAPGRPAAPFVFFVTDDSRSLGDVAVQWTGSESLVPRPLREAAVPAPSGSRRDRGQAVLMAAALSPGVLPPEEAEALASRGHYSRPGDGNDSWLPWKVAEVCGAEAADLDGLACRDHDWGLTADEVLRGTAVMLWASDRPMIGLEGLAFVEAGRTEDRHRVVHSMCGVRNDGVAPCALSDGSIDGTVAALAGRPAGTGRWTIAEVLTWFRGQFIEWNDRAFLRQAADGCTPVILVLGGDFTYKGPWVLARTADVLEGLRGPWAEGKVPAPLLHAVLVHTGDPDEVGVIRDYFQGRGMDWVQVVDPGRLWRDPLGTVLGTVSSVRQGVACVDRAWTVERPWPQPGLADRTDLVALWDGSMGSAVGRLGVRPWVDPAEANILRDDSGNEKVRWMTSFSGWQGRPTYVSYPKGGLMGVVKVTDEEMMKTVAQDLTGLLGLGPTAAQNLLRFHRGDPGQEVDAGGAWRDRCAPWTGDCRDRTEVLGPVLGPQQVVRAWRPTSGLSDFVLLFPPTMSERTAWPVDAEGRLYVGTSQGVTAYKLKTQAGSAPEEVWHFVPWQVLRHLALSALPTSLPLGGPALQGFQVGDRRFLVVERLGHVTVLDVGRPGSSDGGLHPEGPVVVFDSLEPGLPEGVGSGDVQRGAARPVFVARPRGPGDFDLEVITGDRVGGQVCVLQYPASRRPSAGDVTRVCSPAPAVEGGPFEWAAYASGQSGYDVWLVFGLAGGYGGTGPADAPSVLVRWDAAGRQFRGAWALRMEFTWKDPVDGTDRTGFRAIYPYRILVLPDEVVLVGGAGVRSRAPHGYALTLWLPLLEREFPWTPGSPPVPVDVTPGSDRFWMARVSATGPVPPDPQGFRIRWDGWTNRPWSDFCRKDGQVAMCVGWAYLFRDLRVEAVERTLGPPDWGVVPVVLRPWDCGDPERYLAWLPWPWLRSPVPPEAADPGMKLGLDIRMFRPATEGAPAGLPPAGYLGRVVSAEATASGRLVQTAWRRPPAGDLYGGLPRWVFVLPTGYAVPQPVLWPKGSFGPNIRAWRPSEGRTAVRPYQPLGTGGGR